MTTKTIGAILAAVACGAALAVTSCDSRSTAPESSPEAVAGGSKSPNVLTECASIFTDIEHCTIGTAHLVADAALGRAVVTGFDADGNDGVSGSFPDAAEWSQRAIADFGTRTGASIHYAAISDGQAVSKLHIVRVSSTTLQFTPVFTAGDGGNSRFHVHVFNNGVLLGGTEHIDPNTPVSIVGGGGDPDRDGGFKRRGTHKRSSESDSDSQWDAPGACEWSHKTTSPAATFSVRLPNGTTLDGDEVLFTEEVAEGQAVYNDFQRIDITGNLESYTITDESSVPVE